MHETVEALMKELKEQISKLVVNKEESLTSKTLKALHTLSNGNYPLQA